MALCISIEAQQAPPSLCSQPRIDHDVVVASKVVIIVVVMNVTNVYCLYPSHRALAGPPSQ